MDNKDTKIVIAGGHAATTALAVVEEIRNRGAILGEIHWIGTSKAIEGKNGNTLESQLLPHAGVIFHSIIMGRLQRKFSFWTIPSLLKIPIGFFQTLFLMVNIKPKASLSFGGAASFPVVFWSSVLKIPVIIHEQTAVAGRANLLSARYAQRVLLARSSSLIYFTKNKCTVVGNPLLRIYFKKSFLTPPPHKPTIFVTGGSRGSNSINTLLDQSLERLLTDFQVIHQVGMFELDKFKNRHSNLATKYSAKYQVYGTLSPEDMLKMYNQADVVVARAGANTVAEIMALKKPAVLIPIPWSYLNEQYENAKIAVDFGVAEILNQPNATVESFTDRIYKIYDFRNSIAKLVASKNSPDAGAADKLVDILIATLTQ